MTRKFGSKHIFLEIDKDIINFISLLEDETIINSFWALTYKKPSKGLSDVTDKYLVKWYTENHPNDIIILEKANFLSDFGFLAWHFVHWHFVWFNWFNPL